MSILVDDSNKTACRAAEAGLQQKNCAALVRPAGTGKGCIVWELLDAHPEMRVLWVVSCAARLELRRALTKRLGRTLGGRVRLMSCEQLAVQNALGWVALAEFRPGLLVLDGWREMSAKDWTDCVQPLFRLCPGAKLLALGEPDAPGDSCRAAEEMLADAIVEPLALGGAMAEGLLPMPASYTALLWPLEDAMARLRAEVKNLHLPGCPDPNAEKYQALSLAVEKLPPVEQLLAQWLPDAAGRYLVLCEDDAAAAQTAEQAEKLFGAGTHIYKDAEGFAADEAATLRLLVCANGPAVQAPLAGISGVVLVRRSAGPAAYRQMLARALAACGSVPVAELSAAFEALTCVQQLRKECSAAGAEAFPLEEPLSACRRAYRQLRRALDSDWERYYAAAKQMTAEGKTLDVPRSYSFGGVAVGRWLENQRLVRAGKKKGRLTAEQAARLDKIGMNWKKRLELAWENGCASARRYRDSHSDLLVPVHYKDKDGFALGEWIVYNRQRYLSGNLPSDRVERLEALGMVWDTGSILWEKSYAAATAVDRWVADNIPADRDVVPLGFSQGGLVAVHLLRINPERYRAVVSLSGFNTPGQVPGTAPADSRLADYDIPVFYTYGKNDGVIPKYELFATAAWLEEHTWLKTKSYHGLDHNVSLEEFADLRQWLLDNDITSGVL